MPANTNPLPPHRLAGAMVALSRGGTIACPTEAVWGLSCDPFNAEAVARLLSLKRRPEAKGLILVAADIAQLDFLLYDLTPEQRDALTETWPGPATWLIPHKERVPRWVTGAFSTVAVRVSAHITVSALCRAWGGPLVSTSANHAGARPARYAFQVHRYFGSALDCLVPGALGKSDTPTRITDLETGRIIRA